MKKYMLIVSILSLSVLTACKTVEEPLECEEGFHEENEQCV